MAAAAMRGAGQPARGDQSRLLAFCRIIPAGTAHAGRIATGCQRVARCQVARQDTELGDHPRGQDSGERHSAHHPPQVTQQPHADNRARAVDKSAARNMPEAKGTTP